VEVAEIVLHKADQPNTFLYFFNFDRLTCVDDRQLARKARNTIPYFGEFEDD